MRLLSKLLIFFIFSTGLAAHAEFIMKPYEIDNVIITFYWFDTEKEMQEYYLEHFGEETNETIVDEYMRGFSASEPIPSKNICYLDLYAVRPLEVDDDPTLSIGHEVLHCVHGPDYHVDYFQSR